MTWFKYIVVIAIALCSAFVKAAEDDDDKEAKIVHPLLPTHLVPLHYDLKLTPFLIPGNFTVKGRVEITANCHANSRNITLHAVGMQINNYQVICQDTGLDLNVKEMVFEQDRQFFVAHLDGDLIEGMTYFIQIDFEAPLNHQLHGFYRNSYKNDQGEDVWIAVTQFEPTYARHAFPCFDEPALKAQFSVALGRTKDMITLSNMPVRDGMRGLPMDGTDEYVWDYFETSVPMSTYLVAFVVSDFGYKTAEPTENDVLVRIWARKNALDQVDYARNISGRILQYFEDFFDVAYPLPKMDMIAIPDFSAGAMENWGLVTYRETALLYKPGVSSLNNKQRVATVISHELAHQWFGNLVTPSWWTDLWLNEGFASYVEYLGVDAIHPEWRLIETDLINEVHRAMALDMLESSHPISVPVQDPDEISEIFDTISYLKGASIIRMMDHFLGRQTLRRGLSNYLKALKYKAATQDDLWHFLSEEAISDQSLPSNMSVKGVMDTWTLQTGFPMVTVARDYDKGTATLRQDRFRLLPSNGGREDVRWWIPITFCKPGAMNFLKTDEPVWMSPDHKYMEIDNLPRSDEPVIVNVQQTGFYRVNYDPKNWLMICDQLKSNHENIHILNRAQIMDDVFTLARAGVLNYRLALGFTRYLEKETDYVPWRPANRGLSFIGKMMKRTPAYGEYLRYMRNIIQPLYRRIEYSHGFGRFGEKNIEYNRNIVSWACSLRLPECCNQVKKQFGRWMGAENPDADNPFRTEFKRTAYCSAVRDGGETEWNFIWSRYLKSTVASERVQLLRALSCTRELWLLNKLLHLAITPNSGVRRQDITTIFSFVASNVYGRDLAFDFVREKWTLIRAYIGPKGIGKLARGSLRGDRNTRLELRELRQFYHDFFDQLGGAMRSIQQSIEVTEKNVDWMDRNYNDILEWLREQNKIIEKEQEMGGNFRRGEQNVKIIKRPREVVKNEDVQDAWTLIMEDEFENPL